MTHAIRYQLGSIKELLVSWTTWTWVCVLWRNVVYAHNGLWSYECQHVGRLVSQFMENHIGHMLRLLSRMADKRVMWCMDRHCISFNQPYDFVTICSCTLKPPFYYIYKRTSFKFVRSALQDWSIGCSPKRPSLIRCISKSNRIILPRDLTRVCIDPQATRRTATYCLHVFNDNNKLTTIAPLHAAWAIPIVSPCRPLCIDIYFRHVWATFWQSLRSVRLFSYFAQ